MPDNADADMYAGSYMFRRYNTTCLAKGADETEFISSKKSEAYPGLRLGCYIIVGGINDPPKDAAEALA